MEIYHIYVSKFSSWLSCETCWIEDYFSLHLPNYVLWMVQMLRNELERNVFLEMNHLFSPKLCPNLKIFF